MMSFGLFLDYVVVYLFGNIVVVFKFDYCFRLMIEYNNLSIIVEYEYYF